MNKGSSIKGEIRKIELPLVGGPAFTIAILLVGIAAGFILNFTQDQWILLLMALGGTFAYMAVGFVDDWHKVYREKGISERAKFIGVLFVSILAALLYFWLLPTGKEPYAPYIQIPFLGSLLCPGHVQVQQVVCAPAYGHIAYFFWLVLLIVICASVGSFTPIAVDFSDGLDGLSGGLVFSAALGFGVVIIGIQNQQHPEGIVLEVLCLLCAGSVLGFLPWNWPSSWAARREPARRRAKIIMGDSGSLGLGGMLAMIAIFSRQEFFLLIIGGAFVLEGLSALISARMITPFFRKYLSMLRFAGAKDFIPHREFPLPFLATPLHHHYDLLGWDRRRLVYGAWAIGACFALLSVFTGLSLFTWQRYLGRIVISILAYLIWMSGSFTRLYFIGKFPTHQSRHRRLALCYGYPYQIGKLHLYHMVEMTEASEDMIETPSEELILWQRINIYDARALLGLFCYRAGYYPAAVAHWSRIPESDLVLRPTIMQLMNDLNNRLELEEQETRPLKRDWITAQPVILVGNLQPADLPNPYEPVNAKISLKDIEEQNDS